MLEWLTENKDTILTVLGIIMSIATVIASSTTSDTDNKWIATIHKISSALGLNLTGAKGLGKKK